MTSTTDRRRIRGAGGVLLAMLGVTLGCGGRLGSPHADRQRQRAAAERPPAESVPVIGRGLSERKQEDALASPPPLAEETRGRVRVICDAPLAAAERGRVRLGGEFYACDGAGLRLLAELGAHPSAVGIAFEMGTFRILGADATGEARLVGAGCGARMSFGTYREQRRSIPPEVPSSVPQIAQSELDALVLSPDASGGQSTRLSAGHHGTALVLKGARFARLDLGASRRSPLVAARSSPEPKDPNALARFVALARQPRPVAAIVTIERAKGLGCEGNDAWISCRHSISLSAIEPLWGAGTLVRTAVVRVGGFPGGLSPLLDLPTDTPLVFLLSGTKTMPWTPIILPADAETIRIVRAAHAASMSGRIPREIRPIVRSHPAFDAFAFAPGVALVKPIRRSERRAEDGCLVSAVFEAEQSIRGDWAPGIRKVVRFSKDVQPPARLARSLLIYQPNGDDVEALGQWSPTHVKVMAARAAARDEWVMPSARDRMR